MKKIIFIFVFGLMMIFLSGCAANSDNIPKIVDYYIDDDGCLIAVYEDETVENLGGFEQDSVGAIESVAISEDGYYILNGIKTDIVATQVFIVQFQTGYNKVIAPQYIVDGDKVMRPQIEREGYSLEGWYCNGELWRFNSDIVLNDMILEAKWIANEYTVAFNTGIDETIQPLKTIYGQAYELPVLTREGYTFQGWAYDDEIITSEEWTIPKDCLLTACWEPQKFYVTLNANGGTVDAEYVGVEYGTFFDLPVAENSYGVFLGWFYNGERITDEYGQSFGEWRYLNNIEVNTFWTIEVTNIDDLEQLYQYPYGEFKLLNDIDISAVEWVPVSGFTGSIDGNGHTIKGLTVRYSDTSSFYGFIGYAMGGKIFNLTLENIDIDIKNTNKTIYAGGLIGFNQGTTVNDVAVTGKITIQRGPYSDYAGGIAGYSIIDDYSGCSNAANISCKTAAGGIIGYKKETGELYKFTNNINSGSISADIAGGMIGDSLYGLVNESSNSGEITGVNYAGGIIGRSYVLSYISRSFNIGNIKVSSTAPSVSYGAGGLIGAVELDGEYLVGNSQITDSYNRGDVSSAANAGGIIGAGNTSTLGTITITNCYNEGRIEGVSYSGGIGGLLTGFIVRNCVNFGIVSGESVTATISALIMAPMSQVENCYYNCSTSGIYSIQGEEITERYSKDFYLNLLFWNEEVWEFFDDKFPVLKYAATE